MSILAAMPRFLGFFQVLHKSNASNLKHLPLHCKRERKFLTLIGAQMMPDKQFGSKAAQIQFCCGPVVVLICRLEKLSSWKNSTVLQKLPIKLTDHSGCLHLSSYYLCGKLPLLLQAVLMVMASRIFAFNMWKYLGPLRNCLPKLFAEKCGDEKRCLDCALLEGRCTTTASRGFVLNSEGNNTTFQTDHF